MFYHGHILKAITNGARKLKKKQQNYFQILRNLRLSFFYTDVPTHIRELPELIHKIGVKKSINY